MDVEAGDEVAALLERLSAHDASDDDAARSDALEDRIDLISADPGHPLARGLERWFEDRQKLARVSTVFVPALREAWAIVWTLDSDEGADKVVLRLIEQIEPAGG